MQSQATALRSYKRGLAAPFVFLGTAGTAWGSVEASPLLWASSLILVGLGAVCLSSQWAVAATPIFWVALAYPALVIGNNAFLSPAYTSAAPFHAAFLAVGLVTGRRIDAKTAPMILGSIALGGCVLAAWGLWQLIGIGESRATAHFETPATFASVLNFALLPVLVFLVVGRRPWKWAAIGTLLAAAVSATVSRSGLLGLLVGLLAGACFARRSGLTFSAGRALAVVVVLAMGWAIAQSAQFIPRTTAAPHALFGSLAQESSVSRFELYSLAIDAARARLSVGAGYLGFRAVLDANRDRVPSFNDGDTYFVHNDYLQSLLELGLAGLLAFGAMLVIPLLAAARADEFLRRAGDPLPVAMLAAIAGVAAIAAVDFPFYVPICLLLFGIAAGVLDRSLGALNRAQEAPGRSPTGASRRLLAVGVATLAMVTLAPPVIADAAAVHAHRAWRESDGKSAAYWFEVARRFEPRDWRYHWYAGQFWYVQAAQTAKPAAARLADEAFAAGMDANPVEVRNHLGRLATHRQFASLLPSPATEELVRTWVAQAAAVAPHHPGVRAELARLGSKATR